LNFYGQIFELRPDVLKEKREDLLKLVGLAKVRRLTLKHYSKGMLERIG
ncbi:MAG: multidrug ABC transporter ATP-binding protein, partial [bacterium (Candidatus Ratteibacteria) CG23_combo_of_CG06-09_8_20_14_all_48_7]